MAEEPKVETIFDQTIFKEHITQKLIDMFSSINGQKDLYMDYQVLKLLEFTIDGGTLKNLFKNRLIFNENAVETTSKKIVFFVTPQVKVMKWIANIINNYHQKQIEKEFHLIFTPRKTTVCKQILQNEYVYSEIDVRDFNFDLIPMESDLLSLQMDYFFKDFYMGNDLSLVQNDSIERFQSVYGAFPKVFGKGTAAQMKYRQLAQKDFVTPLINQQTYQGLIDEIFQINNNIITIDPKILNLQEKQKMFKIDPESDPIFKQIQNKTLQVVGEQLGQKFAFFKQILDEKDKKRNLEQIGDYLQKFNMVQKDYLSSSRHINLADKLKEEQMKISYHKNTRIEWNIIVGSDSNQTIDHIESLSALKEPLNKVMRIFCLQSQIDKNLKQKQYDAIKTEIIHNYGFEYMTMLHNLEQTGILRKSNQKSNWLQISQKSNLNLTNIDVEIQSSDNSSFAYGGYTPIILVEHALESNWNSISSSLSLINGPTLIKQQTAQIPNKKSLIMVYVIGGVTYGEIATFRFLAEKYNKEIVICTTNIINGNKIIESCKDQ